MKSRVKALRAERGWTQEHVSKLVGVSRYAINALENERHDPSLDLAFRIASAFGLTVEEVFANPYPTTSTGPPFEAERRLVGKVLCVCVANSSRSPMMQAVLQQHLGGAYQVESAGLRKEGMGIGANERSILCLKERGIDLTGHRRRYIADLDLSQYCCIVCVGPAEAEQVRAALGDASTTLLVPNAESGGIPDPYEHGLQGYRDCLALLDVVMPEIARRITSTSVDPGQNLG